MVVSGKCSLVIQEDIIGIFKRDTGIVFRTAYDQTIHLEEQGYQKLEQFFRRRFEAENRDIKHEQDLIDAKRSEYCKGYDDGYIVGASRGQE